MNAKELKIVPPEGYEIDRENSSIDTIRFKPIKKKITYQDVKEKLFPESHSSFYFGKEGAIVQTFNIKYLSKELLLATSQQQLQQIRALNKLMNVAKYLNGNWKPNWNNYNTTKWFIFFDHDKKEIQTRSWYIINPGCVYFKSEELALQAIEILGEEEIKKALGIFE